MNTKETLNTFKQDTTMIQQANMDTILELMFAEIGSIDSELRDHIIYSLFVELILHQPLAIEQLHFIKQTALSDAGMFFKIGEAHTDSVFTRSFSVLLIPLLLDRNKREHFLTEKQIQEMKHAILRYLSEERDFRGHVPDKGWAHALAHVADALHSVSDYGWTAIEALSILDLLKNIIQSDDHVLTNQEEERILIAIMPLIVHRLIDHNALQQWIWTLADFGSTDDAAKDYVILHNVKVFLSALYFKSKKHPFLQEVANSIEVVLDQLHQKFFN